MDFVRRYKIHIILFVLTFASTWYTGAELTGRWLSGGLSYSIPIMMILLGHEMGHYFMSRRYGIRATLPFFLPFPLSPFGTMGAVIRMESAIPSRKALFDVGVAGPLTSFILSVPAILIGLKLSKIVPVSLLRPGGFKLGAPLLFPFIQGLVMENVQPGYEVVLHPVGFAGWAGLFVTALNLLPVGQLDGGHVAYALFGRRSRLVFLIAISLMAFITVFYYPGWILLLILFIIFGLRHPAPLDDGTPLDKNRRLLGGMMFLILLLSFTPTPLPEVTEEFRQLFHWF
jgi:membrane-associated protease RseP (regulator of RpoE activity)